MMPEPARIVIDGTGSRTLHWYGRSAQLDDTDVEILRVLAAQPPARPFARPTAFAHLVPDSPHFALATIRRLVTQLERKLNRLGDAPLIEHCDRRGYRVRVPVVQG